MITTCDNCSKKFKTLPSWYAKSKHHYCSRPCFMEASLERRSKQITKAGESSRFKLGQKPSSNRSLPKGVQHYAWKGEQVGYRGLHYWLRRIKGIPPECQICANPKGQWANIDGRYRRNPDDFISLCSSCHKHYDLALKRPLRVSKSPFNS